MKNNEECKIVRDLFPNYLEGLNSRETDVFINEHVAECEECKIELEKLSNLDLSYDKGEEEEINYLKKVKKKNKFNIILSICILLCIFMVFYIGIVSYRYSLLVSIDNKFRDYNDIKNVYIEMHGIISQSDSFTNTITRKYWYKNGILKKEEYSDSENYKDINIIDYNKNIEYSINEKNKTCYIVKDNDIEKGYENGRIFNTLFRPFYTIASSPYSLKFSSKILSIKIAKEKDNIITDINGYSCYDKNTGLLKMQYLKDFEEKSYYWI